MFVFFVASDNAFCFLLHEQRWPIPLFCLVQQHQGISGESEGPVLSDVRRCRTRSSSCPLVLLSSPTANNFLTANMLTWNFAGSRSIPLVCSSFSCSCRGPRRQHHAVVLCHVTFSFPWTIDWSRKLWVFFFLAMKYKLNLWKSNRKVVQCDFRKISHRNEFLSQSL